jgi:hypothetical protein
MPLSLVVFCAIFIKNKNGAVGILLFFIDIKPQIKNPKKRRFSGRNSRLSKKESIHFLEFVL